VTYDVFDYSSSITHVTTIKV